MRKPSTARLCSRTPAPTGCFLLDLNDQGGEVFAPYPKLLAAEPSYDVQFSDPRTMPIFTIFGARRSPESMPRQARPIVGRRPSARDSRHRGMLDEHGRLWFGDNVGDRSPCSTPTTRAVSEERARRRHDGVAYVVAVDTTSGLRVWTGGRVG